MQGGEFGGIGISGLPTVCGPAKAGMRLGGFQLYDLTGSYTLPFALVGALLFPAALSAFSIRERKYSIRYQAPISSAAATGR